MVYLYLSCCMYSVFYEICLWCCCALFCCGDIIVLSGLIWPIFIRVALGQSILYWFPSANEETLMDIISYPLFADADTGIYPHAASQYHARPKAKRGIAMLSVDKFPYPRKQTRGNEFIPCSNNICDILKRFRSSKIPTIPLIWPKSPYKHSVTRSYRSGN